jgi:hypothetical protein
MDVREEGMWEAVERVVATYRAGAVRDPHLNEWLNADGSFVFQADEIVRHLQSKLGDEKLSELLRQTYSIRPNDIDALLRLRSGGSAAAAAPAAPIAQPWRRTLSEAATTQFRREVARIVTFLPNPGYSVDPFGVADAKVHEAVFELLMTERDEGMIQYGIQRLAGSVKFEPLMAALRQAEGFARKKKP